MSYFLLFFFLFVFVFVFVFVFTTFRFCFRSHMLSYQLHNHCCFVAKDFDCLPLLISKNLIRIRMNFRFQSLFPLSIRSISLSFSLSLTLTLCSVCSILPLPIFFTFSLLLLLQNILRCRFFHLSQQKDFVEKLNINQTPIVKYLMYFLSFYKILIFISFIVELFIHQSIAKLMISL